MNDCSVMSWKGPLVVTSPGGSPDMVSWSSLDVEAGSATVSAEPARKKAKKKVTTCASVT